MAERVGNPVPKKIRERLARGETPLVYELMTPPKDPGAPETGSWAQRLADTLRSDAQHEVLLTKNRIAVVATQRSDRSCSIELSVPLDEVVSVELVGSGVERGRLRFDFRDGSSTCGVMGLVLPRPARRFLASFEAATPRRRR
ncbi:hypothetical protein [Actinospongicola halichondriae]|uniref:hypothetical protein n=1 Tax=Actinospongicola halichondriae TaxID=3236844 RepID=UPI003D45F41F